MKKISVILLFLLISTISSAQQSDSKIFFMINNEKITMSEMIKIVLERNFDMQKVKYDAAMSDSSLMKFQKKYAVYLSGETGYNKTNYPEALEQSAGKNSSTVDASVGIMKMFQTGTTITAGVKNEYTDLTKDPTTIPMQGQNITIMPGGSTYHQSSVFVQLQQELLKNSFGTSERKQEKILKNVSDMQREAMKQAMSGVVVKAIIDYWNLALAKITLDNAELKLKETIKVRNIIRENVKLGLSEAFENNFYNALVAGAESVQLLSQQQYNDAQRKILQTLNYDSSVKISTVIMVNDDQASTDESKIIMAALSKRADYNNVQLELQNARLEAGIYENDAMPSLKASIQGMSFSQDESFGTAAKNTATLDSPGWEARLKMEYPLGDTEQAANLRDSKLKLKLAELDLVKTEREIKDDISSKIGYANTAFLMYQKSRKASSESKAYYTSMKANLARGRFTAVQVKNALDAYVDSQQREKEALIQYNIMLLQLDIASNELFEKNGININKYIDANVN